MFMQIASDLPSTPVSRATLTFEKAGMVDVEFEVVEPGALVDHWAMKAIRFGLWGIVAVFAAILGFLFWQSAHGSCR